MNKVFLVGGGTGGHCLPMLTTYNEFKKKDILCKLITDTRGQLFFKSVPPNDILLIKNIVLTNSRLAQIINLPFFLTQAFCICLLSRSDYAIGFGGFITIPFLLVCKILNIKYCLHEANAIMGKANIFLTKNAENIFTAFKVTKKIYKKNYNNIHYVGLPIRNLKYDNNLLLKTKKKELNICILGGSQGSKSLSQLVAKAMIGLKPLINKKIRLSHQCRKEDLKRVKNIYSSFYLNVEVNPFFNDMTSRMKNADLIISRSGSSTVNEIIFYEKPSILIPYPHAAEDHQMFNALSLSGNSCAKIIKDIDLNPRILINEILKIMMSPLKKHYIKSKLSRNKIYNPSLNMLSILKNEY